MHAAEAKHTSVYALLLNQLPCWFRLLYEQSPKNIYASCKSRDKHKNNKLYTAKLQHLIDRGCIK